MPIEIHILSGSRQGEQLRLDGEDVGVGDSAECQVRFPSDSQPAARGRKASLRLNQDGWQLRNQGLGEWFVNHSAVPPQGTSPLRSGDIVRLSASGPDFLFSIVSSRRPASAAVAPASVTSGLTKTSIAPAGSSPGAAAKNSTTTQPAEEIPAPALSLVSDSDANVTVAMNLPLPIVIAGGGVVLVTLVVLAMLLRSGGGNIPIANGVVSNTPTSTTPATNPIQTTNVETTKPQPPPVPTLTPLPLAGPKATVKLSPEQLVEKYGTAVVWLGAELKGHRLPYCTGWAAKPDTIVSTAREIAHLKQLQDKGHDVFAYVGGRDPPFVSVTKLSVHPHYDVADPGGAASLLHNVGAARLAAPLASHCDLLPSQKLERKLGNFEVTVLGFSIPYQPNIEPFNRLNPPPLQPNRGRMTGTLSLAGSANDLPLARLEIAAPDGFDGAPLFDSAGQVAGLLIRLEQDDKPHAVLADNIHELLRD